MSKRLIILFLIVAASLLTATPAQANHIATHCHFAEDFAQLRDMIGHHIVGDCSWNERVNHANGDRYQATGSGFQSGMMVWRQADGRVMWTDGSHTWILGPDGLQKRINWQRFPWELDYTPDIAATPLPVVVQPTPSPTPTAPPPTDMSLLRDFVNGPWLEAQHPQLATAIKNLSWARDSIDDRESEVIQHLLYIVVTSHFTAESIVSLNWMRDDIDAVEAEAIRWLNNIGSATVASSVVSLGWVQDGIHETEVKTIQQLSYLANNNAEGALRIVAMPFLETIEPPDVTALVSLRRLAAFRPEAFAGVMSHTAVRDGIADEETPIVATLDGVAKTNPRLIDVLLNPSRVFLERRIISLPLSGGVILDIIRTAPGAARSMDLLEHSVREAEAYMGVPFPTKHVVLLYENAVTASFAGTNFGTHIASLPKYDSDDDSREAAYAGNHTAHEVAHYYWSGNKDWIDEGAANFMAAIIENARTGRPLGVDDFPCAYADSIAELESLNVVHGDSEFLCNYALGERLFLDLHHTLGHEKSRQGFRALYLASESEDDAELGIQHVREAFRSNDAAVRTVIARWYNGTQAYDLSRLDRRPVNSRLPGINGRINKAYIATRANGPAVSVFSAQHVTDWVYLTLKYSYNVSGAKREVPLEIVEYYEDGFEFRRQSDKITAESRYIGGTQWRRVGFRPSQKWAPGRYWVYVYAGGRKVAETQYRVTP